MKRVTFIFVALAMAYLAFEFWQREPLLPVATHHPKMLNVNPVQVASGDYATRLGEIIVRANSSGNKTTTFGEARLVCDNTSINTPPFQSYLALDSK